ncbi:MAG TPA: M28 family peptidase [Cytophagaceae bacterium]|nr:M28 family peptidase [Cytophagaceae bacterium]
MQGSLFVALSLLAISCSEKKRKLDETQSTKAITESKLDTNKDSTFHSLFNEDSAYQYIVNQLAFGPRVPNTAAHDKCGLYLNAFFQKHGAWVHIQNFQDTAYNGIRLNLRNFIVSYNFKATKRIIIASHWDTRPIADQDKVNTTKAIPGANDGASGVAIIMEIARAIHAHPLKQDIGIDLILFDGEDYGAPDQYKVSSGKDTWCLGSKHWSKSKHRGGYSAYYGILLDMVGAPGARFAWDETSRLYAPSVLRKVWNEAAQLGYGKYFIVQNSPEIIDDHLYVNEDGKIPMIDIIQYDPSIGRYFADYWHTHRDDISAIDKKTLKAVGETLLQVLYKEE